MSLSKLSKLSIRAIVFAICAVFLVAAAHAQFRAGIEGTVTDSSGAAVKEAKITVTNQETGNSVDFTTSDTGFYSVPHLPPGKYTVTVTLAGFKTKIVKDIDVSAESVQAVNLTIEPGAVTETVEVTGSTLPTLQTEEAGINGTISEEQITRLPEVGRDPYELVRLTPGVFGTGSRNGNGDSTNLPNYSGPGGSNNSIFQTENAVQVSANGQRVEANGFSIDGVSVNSQAWGGAAVITPNEESVKEIKVESNTYSAENGRYSGALVEVVSQNGTNNFHGSFVFKLHSPGLNAFQRWGGPQRSFAAERSDAFAQLCWQPRRAHLEEQDLRILFV